MYSFPVVPLCERQLRDVNPEDVLENGLYRSCQTYKAGGGYDQFPDNFTRRYQKYVPNLHKQFVVQLGGCPLSCSYCYVTPDGVRGRGVSKLSRQLVDAYKRTDCGVFHLMGGAPALYLEGWPDLLQHLNGEVFHSDFLLCEGHYDQDLLRAIARYPNQLHAVSFKAASNDGYAELGLRGFSMDDMFDNLMKLWAVGMPFYITFTGMSEEDVRVLSKRICDEISPAALTGSFTINVRHYKALE